MELSQILGYTATFIFTAMYIPQIIKTIKKKSVKDISLTMFLMGFVGNIIALWYAILIDQRPLQIKYILALIFIGVYLTVYYGVRKEK